MNRPLDELSSHLERNFSLKLHAQHSILNEEEFLKQLQLRLSERILFLIRTNMDTLLQILYRIDVDDALSSQAFDLGEIHAISNKLAELIIQRQLAKINYRSQN